MQKRIPRFSSTSVVILAVLAWLSSPLQAVDGVIEINQTRALAGGVTPTDTPGFPVTLDTAGSYILTGSLNSTAGGIEITGSNVTIDLNGFTVSGGTGTGIHADFTTRNISLRNGVVSGCSEYGVFLEGRDWHIEKIHAHNNTLNGFRATTRGIISDSTASDNGGTGIITVQASVFRCVSHDNGGAGIIADGGVVRGCVVQDNIAGGIDSASSVVTQNRASGPQFGVRALGGSVSECDVEAGGSGILARGNGTRVTGNTSSGGSIGVEVTASYCRIDGNHVTGADRGIKVTGASNTIVRNTSANNTFANYEIDPGNDVGPIGTAASATSPWANIE